jgi:hypothetical protein
MLVLLLGWVLLWRVILSFMVIIHINPQKLKDQIAHIQFYVSLTAGLLHILKQRSGIREISYRVLIMGNLNFFFSVNADWWWSCHFSLVSVFYKLYWICCQNFSINLQLALKMKVTWYNYLKCLHGESIQQVTCQKMHDKEVGKLCTSDFQNVSSGKKFGCLISFINFKK